MARTKETTRKQTHWGQTHASKGTATRAKAKQNEEERAEQEKKRKAEQAENKKKKEKERQKKLVKMAKEKKKTTGVGGVQLSWSEMLDSVKKDDFITKNTVITENTSQVIVKPLQGKLGKKFHDYMNELKKKNPNGKIFIQNTFKYFFFRNIGKNIDI